MDNQHLTNFYGFKHLFMVYDNADIDKRGEQSLHETVQHCMDHIATFIQNINTLGDSEIEELTLITQKIDNWSLAKCNFYDASWVGFLKRIISCFRNAWSFGVFRSSGEQGLILASTLRQEIQKKRDLDNLEPEEIFRIRSEKIVKNTEREYFKLFNELGKNEIRFKADDLDKNVQLENTISPYSADNSPYKGKRVFYPANSGKQVPHTTIQISSASPSSTTKPNLDSVRGQFNNKHEAIVPKSFKENETLLNPSRNKLTTNRQRSLTLGEIPTIESASDQKNERQNIGLSRSLTDTPPPKTYAHPSPSWQINQKKKIELIQMPINLSVFDQVLYRLEYNVFEFEKMFDLLNLLLQENKLGELIESLGTSKLLDIYWLCESSEQICSESHRLARIERLKIVFKNLSEDQFEKSVKLENFFKIIGNNTNHYARVATDLFEIQQLTCIASSCDTEPRLALLCQIIIDLPSSADSFDTWINNNTLEHQNKNEKLEQVKIEIHNQLCSKIKAIIAGIGKLTQTLKTNDKCLGHLKKIEEAIGKKALKDAKNLIELLKDAIAN